MKLRKIFIKTPSKKRKIIYKKAKPKKARCSICKKPLAGTLRERDHKMKNLAKSKKVPTRPYAGVLCSKCVRERIIDTARIREISLVEKAKVNLKG